MVSDEQFERERDTELARLRAKLADIRAQQLNYDTRDRLVFPALRELVRQEVCLKNMIRLMEHH